jgi:hypothetical protein
VEKCGGFASATRHELESSKLRPRKNPRKNANFHVKTVGWIVVEKEIYLQSDPQSRYDYLFSLFLCEGGVKKPGVRVRSYSVETKSTPKKTEKTG